MAVLGAVAMVMAISTLILFWTVEEGPTAVSQGTDTFTGTCEKLMEYKFFKKNEIVESEIMKSVLQSYVQTLKKDISYHQVLPVSSVHPHFPPEMHTTHTEAWKCTGNTG